MCSHNCARLWIDPTPEPRNCICPLCIQYTIIHYEDMKTDRIDCRTCKSLTPNTTQDLCPQRLSRQGPPLPPPRRTERASGADCRRTRRAGPTRSAGPRRCGLDLTDDPTVAKTLKILGAGDDYFHAVVCHRTTNRFFRFLHRIAVGHYLL